MPDHGRNSRPIIFGEVLFDHFPDGRAALGGAPFNVAWHLRGFGLDPLLITRIGEDVPGEWVLEAMKEWGLDTRGVQQDPDHATGSVQVSLREGEPQFRILGNQAYDHIAAAPALALLAETDAKLFYHGTLAARSETSRATLNRLRAAVDASLYVDANLRDPWWEERLVEELFADISWLKLSRRELHHLAGMATLNASAELLLWRHRLPQLVITDGPHGAWRFGGEEPLFVPATEVPSLADTVGAGDAFTAVCLLGATVGWAPLETLQRASEFAAFICTRTGAISKEPSIYNDIRLRWFS